MDRFIIVSSVMRFGNALPATVVLQDKPRGRWPTGKRIDLLDKGWQQWLERVNWSQEWIMTQPPDERLKILGQIMRFIRDPQGGPSQGVNANGLLKLNRVCYLGQEVRGYIQNRNWAYIPGLQAPQDGLTHETHPWLLPAVSYCDWTGRKIRKLGGSRDHVVVPIIGGGYLPLKILKRIG